MDPRRLQSGKSAETDLGRRSNVTRLNESVREDSKRAAKIGV
jgi:hypothetical protein